MKNRTLKNGKKLGVIGGMGPAASAEFLRLIADKVPAEKDQDHPIIVMISDSEMPDRTLAIKKKDMTIAERLQDDFSKLDNFGVDYYAVPCNTSHYFIDCIKDNLSKPLIHIIDETMNKVSVLGCGEAWILATLGTIDANLYQKYAKKYNINIVLPPKEIQDEIHKTIYLVKSHEIEKAKIKLDSILINLINIKEIPVVLACTELPLIKYDQNLYNCEIISCLDILANACVRRLYDIV